MVRSNVVWHISVAPTYELVANEKRSTESPYGHLISYVGDGKRVVLASTRKSLGALFYVLQNWVIRNFHGPRK